MMAAILGCLYTMLVSLSDLWFFLCRDVAADPYILAGGHDVIRLRCLSLEQRAGREQ